MKLKTAATDEMLASIKNNPNVLSVSHVAI